jgi:PAS domain S-box-containing protein
MSPELNYLPIGAFFTDLTCQVTSCNLKYRATLNAQEDNPQWLKLVHEDDRGKILKEWQIALSGKKSTHVTCRLIKSNSNIIWVDIRLAPVYSDANILIGFSGTLLDITNQIMFDKVLERFKKAVEKTDSQIIFTDANGVVTFANESVEKLTGFTSGQIIGTKAGKLWGGLMDKAVYTKMWQTIKVAKQPFEGEFINKKKTGETYYANVNITPVLNELKEVEFFVGIERDITYLKEVDKVKTEFISLASHQLRTPLSSIKWLCELFWQEGADNIPQDQKVIMQKVQTENERLIKLVNSLLTVSRIDANKLAVSPVNMFVDDFLIKCVGDIKPKLLDKHQTLELLLTPNLPEVTLDQKLVEEALANLLSNAHKYTPEGGRLWVKAGLDQQNLVLSITDSGIGIPADDQHRIFDKFFRAKNAQLSQTDGNGLGLYFVKWVMDQHGGKVWFDSKEGIGTTFYLAFPLPAKN